MPLNAPGSAPDSSTPSFSGASDGTPPPDVIHLVAEYWPFVRTGGLAEAVSGLAGYQHRAGSRVSVLLPLHRAARKAAGDLVPVGEPFHVQVGPRLEAARLLRQAGERDGPAVYFVDHPAFFDRPGIYGEGSDYPDNHIRFAFYCLAALQVLPTLATDRPLVIHAHDWHTALTPLYLRTAFAGNPVHDRAASVLSVHNAGYQGHFPPRSLEDLGIPSAFYDWRYMEWYGRANLLKGGLAFTDMATTVSPTHAFELRTAAGGFGLHDVFVGLRDRLVGILNGIDLEHWNPATDPDIPATYSREDLTGKAVCKAAVQREYNLPVDARVPLVAMAARLVHQKGLDLILASEAVHRDPGVQFVFLGTGEQKYVDALSGLARGSDRVSAQFHFSDAAEHRLIAGADVLLMPSLYEPCGLTQMRAQRYGAIPVARRVGGLADTIEDGVTGILFDEYLPERLDTALRRAVARFADAEAWGEFVQSAMSTDFGWERTAARYYEVYRRALHRRRPV
jgi:starch synthase